MVCSLSRLYRKFNKIMRTLEKILTHLALTNSIRCGIDIDGEQHVFDGATFIGDRTSGTSVHVTRQ